MIRAAELKFSTIIPAISTYRKELVTDQRTQSPVPENKKIEPENNYCRWWITNEGILLHIPGDLSSDKIPMYRRLLRLLKRYQKYLVLHSILCVISIPDS